MTSVGVRLIAGAMAGEAHSFATAAARGSWRFGAGATPGWVSEVDDAARPLGDQLGQRRGAGRSGAAGATCEPPAGWWSRPVVSLTVLSLIVGGAGQLVLSTRPRASGSRGSVGTDRYDHRALVNGHVPSEGLPLCVPRRCAGRRRLVSA